MKHKGNTPNKDSKVISLYFSNLHHKLRNYILDDPNTIDRYLIHSRGSNYYNL